MMAVWEPWCVLHKQGFGSKLLYREFRPINMARVVLMHNHTRNTRIHLAEKNMDTISHAQGNMSALFYGHGNMSRNWNFTSWQLQSVDRILIPPGISKSPDCNHWIKADSLILLCG